MAKYLYPCFNWPGTVWLYSDPHFGDEELYTYRGTSVELGDEEQIKRINSKVGKNDTIVFLGDIGDMNLIKKIRGYKVLICGNHDKGATNYQRIVKDYWCPVKSEEKEFIDSFDSEDVKLISVAGNHAIEVDNKLFDEVYSGCLMINEKIILSHEPVDFRYAFNIHGHDHSGADFIKYVLNEYDADISSADMSKIYLKAIKSNKLNRLNLCSEWIGYYPVALSQIVKSGVLSDIENIHRVTIDKATDNKINRENYNAKLK